MRAALIIALLMCGAISASARNHGGAGGYSPRALTLLNGTFIALENGDGLIIP